MTETAQHHPGSRGAEGAARPGATRGPADEAAEHASQHRQLIELHVNGEAHEVFTDARRTLVDVIRHDLRLTGTHVGCEHGVCGACTVLLDGEPVRACLMFAAQAEGKEVRTVESLSDGREPGDLQRAFSEHHGLQCGFCTPGFLMLAEGFLAERPQASKEEIREVVASNLCRCTGYQTIVEAIDDCATRRRAALQERLDGEKHSKEVRCGSTTRSR